jgi:hypothetical protein
MTVEVRQEGPFANPPPRVVLFPRLGSRVVYKLRSWYKGGRMPGKLLLFALTTVCLSYPAAARGDVITFNSAFAGSVDPIDVTAFDPALGVLNSVHVNITGTLQVSGTAPPNGFVLGGAFVPVPYQFRVEVRQDFDGLGSSFFDFTTPAIFQFPGVGPGVPFPFTFALPFVYNISFTASTDVLGFAIPTVSPGIIPPTGASGTREGFVDTGSLNQILLTHTVMPVAIDGPPPQITSFGSVGTLRLEYTYTPLSDPGDPGDPGTPVPEPSSLMLFAVGVLSQLGFRRRQRPR